MLFTKLGDRGDWFRLTGLAGCGRTRWFGLLVGDFLHDRVGGVDLWEERGGEFRRSGADLSTRRLAGRGAGVTERPTVALHRIPAVMRQPVAVPHHRMAPRHARIQIRVTEKAASALVLASHRRLAPDRSQRSESRHA